MARDYGFKLNIIETTILTLLIIGYLMLTSVAESLNKGVNYHL